MKNPTLLLPGFHLPTLRRKPKTEQQKLLDKINLLKQKSFSQLGEFLNPFIPSHLFESASKGSWSRYRFFNKKNTFWLFFSQVLDADKGCQEVIRKAQSVARLKSRDVPSSSTAAYCKARTKLSLDELTPIFKQSSQSLQNLPDKGFFNDRRVVVVDGTGVSMPDTVQNQQMWPQQASQKPGCGFPQATLCACFCLQTGALLSYETGNKKSHELPLLRKQYHAFRPGDIFLGDKGFCSYYDVSCFQDRGVDSVITLARRLPKTQQTACKKLGENDLLIKWQKPKRSKASSYSETQWQALPDELALRQIKVDVTQPGYRVNSFYIVTTLLDPIEYPANQIAELYFQRWDVELFFRDIKTTLGMDILRCKTPSMINKEIIMHFIAYNCIRRLMFEAADKKQMSVRRISFKGSVQALRQWEPHLHNDKINLNKGRQWLMELYDTIASYIVPERPGRHEPRCTKRRPKPFQLLTAPRHEMQETKHRGKNCAKQA